AAARRGEGAACRRLVHAKGAWLDRRRASLAAAERKATTRRRGGNRASDPVRADVSVGGDDPKAERCRGAWVGRVVHPLWWTVVGAAGDRDCAPCRLRPLAQEAGGLSGQTGLRTLREPGMRV